MKQRAKEWASRLTGLSTPLFGASWVIPPSEREVAEELLDQLEDRRVLYNPSEAESPEYCARSVLQIRQYLTASLAKLKGDSLLSEHLKAMRAACRRFLDRMEADQGPDYEAARNWGHWRYFEFLDALGQLRGVFGVHIAFIAARYELSVPMGLQTVLPSPPEDGD
jgi:hypothetical protein